MSEEKRIYVIVPETVQVESTVYLENAVLMVRSIHMPAGRLMAQCAHVVSKMRCGTNDGNWTPVTTIVLSVRNSKALHKVLNELHQGDFEFDVHEFVDTNDDVYGAGVRVLTAICTVPITQEQRDEVDYIIGHLELYGA